MISDIHLAVGENCTHLDYYAVSSGNFLLMFQTTYWSSPQGSRIQKKACYPSTDFVSGEVWAVKSLSSMVWCGKKLPLLAA
jgi:hypothetical protein